MKKNDSISYDNILDNIRAKIFGMLQDKGISKKNIDLKRKTSKHIVEETFNISNEEGSFSISIITKYYLLVNSEKSPRYWYWYIKLNFPINNLHNLYLSLKLESKFAVLKKMLRKKRVEIYRNDFDKVFKIDSDHKFAHLEIITPIIQEKLLSVANNFTFLEVYEKQIEYIEELNQEFTYQVQNRIIHLLDIGTTIGQNIENWSPNLD